MIRLTQAQLQPIGLDIGTDSIRMLQLATSGGSLAVHAACRQSLPDAARQAPAAASAELALAGCVDLIRQMLRTTGAGGAAGSFHGRHVVAALPRQLVHVKNLRLPMIPAAELASAVEFEARNVFGFDTDQAFVRFLNAGEVRQGSDVKQEVIVLAAKHKDVDDFLEQLHRCGVIVDSLDFEPQALYRSVERFIRRREDENEVHVLVDIGCRRSHVVIGRGREISFVKPIDIGGQHLTESVSRKLGIQISEASALRRRIIDQQSLSGREPSGCASADTVLKRDSVAQAVFDATRATMESLGREIALCLRYYSVTFRGQRPTRVKLLGGEACDPDLLAALQAALPIPAEPGRPLHSIDITRMKSADRHGAMSDWAVALGLALKKTIGPFGTRDLKDRDANAPRNLAPAQVVDLNQALQSETGPAASAASAAVKSGVGEVAHA